MPARSLRKISSEMADWLTPGEVNSTLAEIFEAARESEDAQAVADALMEVMVRAGENDEWLLAEDEQRILDWAGENWATEPRPFFSRLCALTANLNLDAALALLEEKHAAESDAGRKAELETTIAEVRGARDKGADAG